MEEKREKIHRLFQMARQDPQYAAMTKEYKQLEKKFSSTRKLALLEELKMMPLGAVYDWFCAMNGAPEGFAFMDEVERYEKEVLSKRK